jgi:autotransporter adhesin
MKNKVLTLAIFAALAAPFGAMAQQAPLGPPCIVATNFAGTFVQSDQSDGFQPASVTDAGVAVGCGSTSEGTSFAGGPWSTARFSSVAIGPNAFAELSAVALGNQSHATNGGAALGELASADDFALALGLRATATNGAVAVGTASVADRAGTVSFGSGEAFSPFGPSTRQLINVSAGTADTDAVNVSQMHPFASAFGGGAGLFGGILTPPSYLFLSGQSFGDVGSALADLDARTAALETGTGSGGDEPFFDATGPAAPATSAEAVAEADNAVAIGAGSVADRDGTVSVGSAGNERQVTNVATGTADTDAANVAQVRAGDQWAISTANHYTDTRLAPIELRLGGIDTRLNGIDTRLDGLDRRVSRLDHRIAQVGAMGAAMGMMASASAANESSNKASVGIGTYDGEQAIAVGWGRGWRAANGRPFSATIGAAFGDGKAQAGIGFSVGISGR